MYLELLDDDDYIPDIPPPRNAINDINSQRNLTSPIVWCEQLTWLSDCDPIMTCFQEAHSTWDERL